MPLTWIDPATLVDRRIYRIRSRNMVVGAWDAKRLGFIGIRRKFGSEYLFVEFEHDLMGPPHGTARAIDDLGADVPEDILMEEYLRTDSALLENRQLHAILQFHEARAIELADAESERFHQEFLAREAAMTPEQKAERERISRERIDEIRKRFADRLKENPHE